VAGIASSKATRILPFAMSSASASRCPRVSITSVPLVAPTAPPTTRGSVTQCATGATPLMFGRELMPVRRENVSYDRRIEPWAVIGDRDPRIALRVGEDLGTDIGAGVAGIRHHLINDDSGQILGIAARLPRKTAQIYEVGPVGRLKEKLLFLTSLAFALAAFAVGRRQRFPSVTITFVTWKFTFLVVFMN
jgi:hypothetical protein